VVEEVAPLDRDQVHHRNSKSIVCALELQDKSQFNASMGLGAAGRLKGAP
jgi:hypothetical protein